MVTGSALTRPHQSPIAAGKKIIGEMAKNPTRKETAFHSEECSTIRAKMVARSGPCVSSNINIRALTVAPKTLGKGIPRNQMNAEIMISEIISMINVISVFKVACPSRLFYKCAYS